MPDNMEIVLVEDNPALGNDIKARLESRYSGLITVHVLLDWPEAEKRLLELLKRSHLVLSDVNLKERRPVNPPNQKFLRTEFDGLRVFGLTKQLNPAVPVILYTGDELAQNALDQFNDPDGPLWVVRKTGGDEIEACADRLAKVAEKLIWDTPLERREEVYKLLCANNDAILNENIQDGQPKWESVLAIISAKKGKLPTGALSPKTLSGHLAPFLPSRAFKISLLSRMFKPRDFDWPAGGETFAIRDPEKRFDDQRSAWEHLLHPIISNPPQGDDKDKWLKAWIKSISDAEQELANVRSTFLESTVQKLEKCLQEAKKFLDVVSKNEKTFSAACSMYHDTSHPLSKSLHRNWNSARKKLFNIEFGNDPFLIYRFYVEWDKLYCGLGYVLDSSIKHSENTVLIQTEPDNDNWRFRIFFSDRGPGIEEFAAAFIDSSMIMPTETPPQNHKLQRAQGLLWGYCDWSVLTKCENETRVRYRDIFGYRKDIDSSDNKLVILKADLDQQKSGTTHILDFPCPLSVRSTFN